VNKIDRSGAHCERVLYSIAEKLTPAIIPMGSASELGTRSAGYAPYSAATLILLHDWLIYSPATTMPCLPLMSTRRRLSHTGGCAASLRRRPGRRWCIRCSSARRSRALAWMR